MKLSDIDNVLWLAGAIGEFILLLVLVYRRVYRSFPIFFGWVILIFLLEPTLYWLLHHLSSPKYFKVFFALQFPQFLLEAVVLAEIGIHVFRPAGKLFQNKSANDGAPVWLPVTLAIAMAVIGVIAFVVASHMNDSTIAHPRAYQVLNATMAILRLATFLCIVAGSQLLSLGWKNQALVLASGFAFYGAVTLIVEIAHSHLRAGPDYYHQFIELDRFRVIGYLCTLYYWCFDFARKEAPKREFNSNMSELLVSIGDVTKRQQSIVARKQK